MASFWPFITVFAKQLGVTEVSVALLFTVAPIAGLISMPLFGAVADRFKMKRNLFIFFNFVNLFGVLSFAFIPIPALNRNVAFECSEGMSYILQNRTGMDQSALRSKCNVSEELLHHSGHSLDSCELTCHVKPEEGKVFCYSFLGNTTPSFCSR